MLKRCQHVLTLLLKSSVLVCPRSWMSLENGRAILQPSGQPVEGTVLHYSCHAGFLLEGFNISHCTKLGKWDSPKPLCVCEYMIWVNCQSHKHKCICFINMNDQFNSMHLLFFPPYICASSDDSNYTGKTKDHLKELFHFSCERSLFQGLKIIFYIP